MEKIKHFVQGGIYLAGLDPSKHEEIGKIRPVIVLVAQIILDIYPATVFVCPLSSKSYPACAHLHLLLQPRDNLHKTSYALLEHCRAVSSKRLFMPRLAQLTLEELTALFTRLRYMLDMDHE